jgi:gliding motility-associated protein GldL
MAKLYGIGASVVILGALFKIQHYPGAGIMLVCGLSTEAVIFFFSAFEPVHEEIDWSLVYPELRTGEQRDSSPGGGGGGSAAAELEEDEEESPTQQLDRMMEEAKIEPELIESLGNGLRTLSDQANKLSDISDASVATQEYTDSLRNASQKVGELSQSYEQASQALTGLLESQEEGKNAGEHLQKMSENLASLNNVYELQLKSSNEQLETTNKLFEGMGDLMQNLNDSVEDTKRYKENISQLSQNLESLNQVYGNMLSAMNVSPAQGQQQ